MMETLWVLQKIKNRTPSNLISGYTSKGNEINLRHLLSHCLLSIIHNSQYMERLDCPCMDECINKMCCVCVYTHKQWNII